MVLFCSIFSLILHLLFVTEITIIMTIKNINNIIHQYFYYMILLLYVYFLTQANSNYIF